MKTFLTNLGLALTVSASAALPVTFSSSWNGAQIIPDNNASGVVFPFSISAPSPSYITSVSVNLNIAGGWNGDLYAYLSHGSGFSVLLNRVGSTAVAPDGFGASGLNLQLADANATDIHNFGGTPVNGSFAPDGRGVSPFSVLDTSPRNAMLDNFLGSNPSGSWTLFLADVSPLSTATLQSWTVTVEAVPEPTCGTVLTLGLTALLLRRYARRSSWSDTHPSLFFPL